MGPNSMTINVALPAQDKRLDLEDVLYELNGSFACARWNEFSLFLLCICIPLCHVSQYP